MEDLSARTVRALKECDQVFGEFYTSKLIDSTPDDLEKVIGKSIVRLKRREVEEEEISDRGRQERKGRLHHRRRHHGRHHARGP